MKLDNAVSAVVQWRINAIPTDNWYRFQLAEYCCNFLLYINVPGQLCVDFMTKLSKLDACLSVFLSAIMCLHVAYKIEKRGWSEHFFKDLSVTSDFAVSLNCCNNRTLSLLKTVVKLAREHQPPADLMNSTEYNPSELVELLQQLAIGLLTAYRKIEVRDFGSVATIVTTDFEALYAYKHGDYQQCLQLSTENVRTLLYTKVMPDIKVFPEFIQLLDDDIVALTALILIVNPECRDDTIDACIITQLTLSLYLMTQCQLKLRHSLTSLSQTLDYVEVAQRRHDVRLTMEQSTLKLIEHKLLTYISA